MNAVLWILLCCVSSELQNVQCGDTSNTIFEESTNSILYSSENPQNEKEVIQTARNEESTTENFFENDKSSTAISSHLTSWKDTEGTKNDITIKNSQAIDSEIKSNEVTFDITKKMSATNNAMLYSISTKMMETSTITSKLSISEEGTSSSRLDNDMNSTIMTTITEKTQSDASSETPQTSTEIHIETTTEDNCLQIPDVQIHNSNISSFAAVFEWEPPENNCSYLYFISLNDEITFNTTELIYTITNLFACVEYNFSIWATYDSTVGPNISDVFKTIIPTPFDYKVTISYFGETNDALNVTWSLPPDEVFNCVTDYVIQWWDKNDVDQGTSQEIVEPSVTSYQFPVIGCFCYSIQIKPRAGDNIEGLIEADYYDISPRVTELHNVTVATIENNFFNVNVETVDKDVNRCNVTEINIACDALSQNNADYLWIVKHANVSEEIDEQDPNFTYSVHVDSLSPFTNYTCNVIVVNERGNSNPFEVNVQTEEEVPSAPTELKVVNITSEVFTIQWKEPENITGVMIQYGIQIFDGRPLYDLGEACFPNITNNFYKIDSHVTSFTYENSLPCFTYSVKLYGIDGAGNGASATATANTLSIVSDPVKNVNYEFNNQQTEEYNAAAIVKFDPPCDTKGPLKNYRIRYTGIREHFHPDNGTEETNENFVSVRILPERNYTFSVAVVTEDFTTQFVPSTILISPAGVPPIQKNPTTPKLNEDGITAEFTLPKDVFGDENGEIIAYSLILFETNSNVGSTESFGFWNGTNDTWPQDSHQITPIMWMPFDETNNETVQWSLDQKYLKENTKYGLKVRGLTRAAYRDTEPLYFQTEMLDDLNLGLILGLIFGILALLLLSGLIFYLWRKTKKQPCFYQNEKPQTSPGPEPIPVVKFCNYYSNLKDNYNLIKEEYTELGLKSKEVAGEITFATLPENRRKNRYTNILPFDSTRVSLQIDEDDEISSDYINASYIKGYTGKIEYIASQGPLETTARDFWKMVIQENVSIIVMVSQFIEQSKIKCYQYFPSNHESVYFGENLEVKCSTELHFGTYCVRTLQVRKGHEQRDVYHMQFLEWPDFGVPQGTDNMLQFCSQMREKVNKEGGLIVVHCSAGVGRTGTLIALDIILQSIQDHRHINIYKTVLDLRKQRTNMVQTEKQYMFIYLCIKDYIDGPNTRANESQPERIYENVEVVKSMKNKLIEPTHESAL